VYKSRGAPRGWSCRFGELVGGGRADGGQPAFVHSAGGETSDRVRTVDGLTEPPS